MKSELVGGALALALTTSCALAQSQPVTIRFAAEFAGKAFGCAGKIDGIGTTKASVTPNDFRLYVSEVELVGADGKGVPLTLEQDNKWQFKNVALLDFETGDAGCSNGTPETRDFVRGTVPAGNYKGIRFKVGVPFELNHQDPTLAPSPLNLTAMFWTWQGGYKFIKIDFATGNQAMPAKDMGAHDGAMKGKMGGKPGTSSGFSIHLGSTMCQSSSRTTAPTACANGNRIEVGFESFDPAKNVVVFDPAPVLATSNVEVNTPETSPGCMSFPNDPECNSIMPKLGFSYGGHKAEAQSFVRMR
jgi:uncharacterized repeat protein (TIGR04052 family)